MQELKAYKHLLDTYYDRLKDEEIINFKALQEDHKKVMRSLKYACGGHRYQTERRNFEEVGRSFNMMLRNLRNRKNNDSTKN